jgi:hypothetical protein
MGDMAAQNQDGEQTPMRQQSGQYTVGPVTGPVQLLVEARVGARSARSPLRTRVARTVRFEVFAFTREDTSDLRPVESYTWRVPAEIGTVLGLGELRLTEVAPVSGIILFEAEGASAEFRVITIPSGIERVEIEPAELVIHPGGEADFDARALDQYGNQVSGISFAWHVVGNIGAINPRTGVFVAADEPGEGYVIAVVSRALRFGDTGAQVQGTGKIIVDSSLPDRPTLYPNWPNPFNSETHIRYYLPRAAQVRLTILNQAGQLIHTLVDTEQETGFYQVSWDGSSDAGLDRGSGLFFLKLQTGDLVRVRKMLLVR